MNEMPSTSSTHFSNSTTPRFLQPPEFSHFEGAYNTCCAPRLRLRELSVRGLLTDWDCVGAFLVAVLTPPPHLRLRRTLNHDSKSPLRLLRVGLAYRARASYLAGIALRGVTRLALPNHQPISRGAVLRCSDWRLYLSSKAASSSTPRRLSVCPITPP